MEKELKEKGRELIDEIFPLSNECAPIADPNYPKRQGFVRGFKEALKLVKNNGVLDDVSVRFLFDFVNEFTDTVIPIEAIEETLKRLNEH